jgi:hypothetical protein
MLPERSRPISKGDGRERGAMLERPGRLGRAEAAEADCNCGDMDGLAAADADADADAAPGRVRVFVGEGGLGRA